MDMDQVREFVGFALAERILYELCRFGTSCQSVTRATQQSCAFCRLVCGKVLVTPGNPGVNALILNASVDRFGIRVSMLVLKL